MKILLIGLLAFTGWSSLSSYLYVCRIKGLCSENVSAQTTIANHNEAVISDTVSNGSVRERALIPKDLTIYFAFDKSEFKPDAKTIHYFDESNAFLEQNSNSLLTITGYTDSVGSFEYNQDLGYRRAQSMQHFFESKGIVANKIRLKSKGESDPADNNNSEAGRANNRRAAITINN
jgi:outer membrane protein OmpA-like peptidoglycan-associated protein